jgi:hypothetical protein
VHLLQIWLLPNRTGVTPAYNQRHFPPDARRGRLALLVSPDGRDGSIVTQQDALLYAALLADAEAIDYPVAAGRQVYVHLVRGRALANGQPLAGGDGAHLTGESPVTISGIGPDGAEVLLFDLP